MSARHSMIAGPDLAWRLAEKRQPFEAQASKLPHSKGGTLIVGMGVDIAEVGRIQGAIERHGEVFLRRVYGNPGGGGSERVKNKDERGGGRVGGKEAAIWAAWGGWRGR